MKKETESVKTPDITPEYIMQQVAGLLQENMKLGTALKTASFLTTYMIDKMGGEVSITREQADEFIKKGLQDFDVNQVGETLVIKLKEVSNDEACQENMPQV